MVFFAGVLLVSVPPLPIPNREVKAHKPDDTLSGKVGYASKEDRFLISLVILLYQQNKISDIYKMKTFSAKVIPRATKNRVSIQDNFLKIYVSSPPEKGKANKKIIELVADFFEISKTKVQIKKGIKSKDKIIQVDL